MNIVDFKEFFECHSANRSKNPSKVTHKEKLFIDDSGLLL